MSCAITPEELRRFTDSLLSGALMLAICLLLLTGICGSSACTTSSAQNHRVLVMPIVGSRGATGAIASEVNNRYELVSPKRYAQTARELRAKSRSPKDLRKVSKKLAVVALVDGEFIKVSQRNYELRLLLRAGNSGKPFDEMTLRFRSKKLGKRDRAKIRKSLAMALSEIDTWDAQQQRQDTELSAKEQRRQSAQAAREADRVKRQSAKEARQSAKRERLAVKERARQERLAVKERARQERLERKRAKAAEENYEVVTKRDATGQAIDDEDPF